MADICHCLDCQCFSGAPYRASVPAEGRRFPPVEREPQHLRENSRQRRETGAGLLRSVRYGPLRLRGRKPGCLPPASRRDPPAGGNPAAPANLACLSASLGVRHRRTALVAGRLMATVYIRLALLSATVADAVVDAVVLLPDRAVERRCRPTTAERLRERSVPLRCYRAFSVWPVASSNSAHSRADNPLSSFLTSSPDSHRRTTVAAVADNSTRPRRRSSNASYVCGTQIFTISAILSAY